MTRTSKHSDKPPANPVEPPAEEAAQADPRDQAIALLAEQLSEAKDQYLRAMADYQNLKRRSEQDRVELRKTATESLVRELLPVLDNFERGIAAAEAGADIAAVLEGVRAVERNLRSVLDSRQVTRIPAVGQPFDPELHEAIVQTPVEGTEPGTVLEEIEAGYRMGDRVLRPAKVRVAG